MIHTKHGVPLLELKSIEESGKIAGYGSVFGNRDSHAEVVMPGAFSKSLADHRRKGSKPKMFWQHDMGKPIGKWLDFSEDGKGLYMEGQLNMEVQQGREAHALLKAGDIDGLSIGYRVPVGGAEADEKAGVVRLKELQLLEVSVVSLGSNDRALVDEVKAALEGGMPSLDQFDELLREAGFSKTQRSVIAGKGFLHLLRSESGTADQSADFVKRLHAALVG